MSQSPIYDVEGKVVDFVYLDANAAFLKPMNLSREQVIGRRATELLGTVEDYWFEAIGEIAKTGQDVHSEEKSGITGRYYDVYAWKARSNQVGVIFEDITQRKDYRKEGEG